MPVVFVHGSSGGLDSFAPVLPHLPDVEAWVYARRGSRSFPDEVRDLATVLDSVGRPAHVVGASYGAIVALHAALTLPLLSLAVFEPPLFAAGAPAASVLEPFRALITGGRLVEAGRLFASRIARVPDTMLGDSPASPALLPDVEALAADSGDLARWTAVDAPTLLMSGALTWSPMPETMEALAAAMPKAARVVFEGQSHFTTHTAPAAFAEALRDFWAAL